METYRYTPATEARALYEVIYDYKTLFAENPTTNPETIAKRNAHITSYRSKVHDLLAKTPDPIATPLTSGAHRYIFPFGDSDPTVSDIWFEADDGETDEELTEYCDSMRIEIHSPFDCTGKRFTASITWKRTPFGIRFIHTTTLDI